MYFGLSIGYVQEDYKLQIDFEFHFSKNVYCCNKRRSQNAVANTNKRPTVVNSAKTKICLAFSGIHTNIYGSFQHEKVTKSHLDMNEFHFIIYFLDYLQDILPIIIQ